MATNDELIQILEDSMFRRYWQYITNLSSGVRKNLHLQFYFNKKFRLIIGFIQLVKSNDKFHIDFCLDSYVFFMKEYAYPKQKCILLILQDRGS